MSEEFATTVYRVSVMICLAFLCTAALDIGTKVECIRLCHEANHAAHCNRPQPPAPDPLPAPQNPKPNNNPGAAGPSDGVGKLIGEGPLK